MTRCFSPESRPIHSIVKALRAWTVEEIRADMHAVDQTYPALGARDALKSTGLVLG